MKHVILAVLVLALTLGEAEAQLNVGDKVPVFETLDQNGDPWSLADHLDEASYLVVYFYPAAFTGGCTKQACAYRDLKGELAEAGAQVVGVSGDEAENLELFALEHQLNFTLLSDEKGNIAELFGVPRNDGGSIDRDIQGNTHHLVRGTTIQRWTFVLDRNGMLVYKDSEVDAAQDSQQVLEFLGSLN
ncbi:MAG: peroxiredoxin [Bacteroidales bacterium]